MRIERVWAMPNKWTFQIKPIAKLLKEEMNGGTWIDPYCGENSPAQITNDMNVKIPAKYHLDALEFLKNMDIGVDGCLFDPPFSLRQLKECYESIGMKPNPDVFNTSYQAKQKDIISRIIKAGGKCISFGWHSNGIGKTRGFQIERILLVAHGRQHNDTIVTVERKINTSLF